ncbi:MAG TPA: winged helix DNA-binding domain-containing protein, partial [Micromonosporaceae bacterium]
RTGAAAAELLGERWPALDALTIQNTLRTFLALVQVPPRGLWGRSGAPTLTTLEAWLGAPLPPDASIDAMVLRYLAAFGPASVADAQAWSGMTRLGEVFARLADRLTSFASPSGATLYDLPDAPRPDADHPAPVRLLAEFDNLTLSYADRTRVLSDDDRRRAYTVNGLVPGMILVDGAVAGVWKRRAASLTLTPYRELRKRDRDAVMAEAMAMLAFATPDTPPDVTWSE